MSEQKGKTLQQRRDEKHLILLSAIEEFLAEKSDVRQTALDFVEYCKANKMTFRNANPINYYNWNVYFKGEGMAAIRFRYKGVWKSNVYNENFCYVVVNFDLYNLEHEKFVINENLCEVVWEHVKRCEGCLTTCAPGKDITLFGRTLNNVCIPEGGKNLRFINPDAESLHCIKKLMEFRKGLISAGKV